MSASATYSRVEDDWAIITRYSMPSRARFVRDISVFVRRDDGAWRRDDERHENVLIDTASVPVRLTGAGVDWAIAPSFGGEQLPAGMRVLIGRAQSPLNRSGDVESSLPSLAPSPRPKPALQRCPDRR